MKVVILCGGEGTRMKEETEFKPKPLVEVGGKPILWHIMKIYAHYGFNEFILALGYKGNMIKDYFMNWRIHVNNFTLETKNHNLIFYDNGHDDFKITFVDTGLKSSTGERVRRLQDYTTEDEFMMTYGDGVANIDIEKLLKFHKNQNTLATITGVRPLTKYGIIRHNQDSNKITGFSQNLVGDFTEKQNYHDFFINGGFMVFKKEVFNLIQPNSMIEEIFIPLAKQGELSMYNHQGKWKAMDTYKEVEEMNEYWKKDAFWKIWETAGNTLLNKNILVTGGAGLVGSHVVEKLLSVGAKVFVMDVEILPQSYFITRGLNTQCQLFYEDVRNFIKLNEIVKSCQIDFIFHLAAEAIVEEAFKDPYTALDTNIMGTVSVLEAARQNPTVKGVVVASSDKAYGKNSFNVSEDQPLAGDHPYDVSKSSADLICTAYHRTYNLPVTISRFGNIYGPGDLNFSRIVPGIMDSLITGKTLEIRSDGSFMRDYVYVKDVAAGYIMLAEQIQKSAGQAFNFSSGHNFSVLEIISKTEEILNKKIDYKIVNNQRNEIPKQSLNFEKVKKILGWQPESTLRESLEETYNWYLKILKH